MITEEHLVAAVELLRHVNDVAAQDVINCYPFKVLAGRRLDRSGERRSAQQHS
jgi:hypothetical protein